MDTHSHCNSGILCQKKKEINQNPQNLVDGVVEKIGGGESGGIAEIGYVLGDIQNLAS